MGHAIALVMLVGIAGSLLQLARGSAPVGLRVAAVAAIAAPVALAALRVVPSAVRLGARADPVETQSALARAICRDHLLCLAAIAAFLALQLGG